MSEIIQLNIDFERGLNYFTDDLMDTNTLSTTAMKIIDFRVGRFYTYLPSNVNMDYINDFRRGGIAIGVWECVEELVFNLLNTYPHYSCVFDDFNASLHSGVQWPLLSLCGYTYNNTEIYYITSKTNASRDIIADCFRMSNAIWHSLCIVSSIKLDDIYNRVLTLSDIEAVVQNAQLVIVGAYDGEGYIFWERKNGRN
jgi:hypothetical protein